MRTTDRVAATVIAIAFALVPAPDSDAAQKTKGKKKDGAALVVSLDLASLAIDGSPALTITMPDDVWRADLTAMVGYPRTNEIGQLNVSRGKRVASRWLQATYEDGRRFDSQIFLVVEPSSAGSLRRWARRIANESNSVYPFEDARFDGPWIVNALNFKLAGRKRLRGLQLENSGGRIGEEHRSVWQFALLPMPAGFDVLIGTKRRAPRSWAPGKGGPPTPGTIGDGGAGLGESGDGSGALPGSGGDGDGSLDPGVGEPEGMGDVRTEPDANQIRASSELLRTLIAGIHVAPSKRLLKGERRFQLRDERATDGGTPSRYVGISVPATWWSTPTTMLQGDDRVEWIERDEDGATTAIARVELLSVRPRESLHAFARLRFADLGPGEFEFVDVETRDGTSSAALCEQPVTSAFGLRAGDDDTWNREFGFVSADSTLYEVEILYPPGKKSRGAALRAILESVEIFVAH